MYLFLVQMVHLLMQKLLNTVIFYFLCCLDKIYWIGKAFVSKQLEHIWMGCPSCILVGRNCKGLSTTKAIRFYRSPAQAKIVVSFLLFCFLLFFLGWKAELYILPSAFLIIVGFQKLSIWYNYEARVVSLWKRSKLTNRSH